MGHAFHLFGEQALHLFRLRLGTLHDQLVVDLKHQPGLQPLGFQEAGRRKNYYDLPKEDALILTRRFDGEAAQ